ncbi:MAG: hypothetical protein R3A51_11655 [Nannocystaceae bacterium]
MNGARELLARIAVVALGLVALAAGVIVGASGCSDCGCTREAAIGRDVVTDSEQRPELIGAELEATEETIEIRYTLADASQWQVIYAVTAPLPGE